MLCPEVWNLRPKNNSIVIKSGVYSHKNKKYVDNVIRHHPFNQIISLVLPNNNSVPEAIVDLIKDSDHYCVENFDLKALIDRQFIEGFSKRGKFTALSYNPRNDVDDCYAVTPDGKLILSIHKELYQTLGIEGQRSTINSFKFIIKIDLKHPDLITGKSYLERVKRALANEAFTNLTLQFFWDPPSNTTICPSSAAKYFNDCNYTVNLCSTKVKTFNQYSLKCPKFEPENLKKTDIAHELVEYVSMQMLSCDTDGDEILNSYCNKLEVDEINVAQIIHCKGFFSATFIERLVDVLRKSDIDLWVSVYIHGFEYSPLSFFNKEHSFSTNGDNSCMMFFYPNNRYLMYQNCSSNKLKNQKYK